MKVKLYEDAGSITTRAELVQRLQLLWRDITIEKMKNCIPRYPVVWLLSLSAKALLLNIILKRTFLSFLACNCLHILIFKLFSIKQFVLLVVDSNV